MNTFIYIYIHIYIMYMYAYNVYILCKFLITNVFACNANKEVTLILYMLVYREKRYLKIDIYFSYDDWVRPARQYEMDRQILYRIARRYMNIYA